MMTYDEIRRALDGLYAYDMGSTDSGIHDPDLKAAVIADLEARPSNERRALVSALIVDLCVGPEAVAQGYGPEDARNFIDWLEEVCPTAVIYVYSQ